MSPHSLENIISVTLSIDNVLSEVSLEQVCDHNYLIPSWRSMNFPSGQVWFRVVLTKKLLFFNTQQEIRKQITFESLRSEIELVPSDSNNIEIFESESKSITFLLRNPTLFPSNFTLNGSMEQNNGLRFNKTGFPDWIIIYPQETIHIDVIITTGEVTTGTTNMFTLYATNGCENLRSFQNITVVEKVSQNKQC